MRQEEEEKAEGRGRKCTRMGRGQRERSVWSPGGLTSKFSAKFGPRIYLWVVLMMGAVMMVDGNREKVRWNLLDPRLDELYKLRLAEEHELIFAVMLAGSLLNQFMLNARRMEGRPYGERRGYAETSRLLKWMSALQDVILVVKKGKAACTLCKKGKAGCKCVARISGRSDEMKCSEEMKEEGRKGSWVVPNRWKGRTMTRKELLDLFWTLNGYKASVLLNRLRSAQTRWEKSFYQFLVEKWDENWREEGHLSWEVKDLVYCCFVPFMRKEYFGESQNGLRHRGEQHMREAEGGEGRMEVRMELKKVGLQ